MNVSYKRDDFKFNARSSAIIVNSDGTKVLLFNVEGSSTYLLPGGKIKELEESVAAISREVKEEIGFDGLEYSLVGISEEFDETTYKTHQFNFIYYAIYNGEINELRFKGLEGDWANFEWVDISNITNYTLFPSGIENTIVDPSMFSHFVENLLDK